MGENVLRFLLACLMLLGVGLWGAALQEGCDQHTIPRRTQRCEIEGRSLRCQRNSAWYVGGSCSCFNGERRISWGSE
jgi:hypothetical protein